MSRIGQLKDRYDAAFQTWACEVSELQRVREQASDAAVLDGALRRADNAATTYRETRDELAGELSSAASA
jgi:hypothetical protein